MGITSDGAQQPPDENAMLFPIFLLLLPLLQLVRLSGCVCGRGRRVGGGVGVGQEWVRYTEINK